MKILNSKVVYRCPILNVEERKVKFDNGHEEIHHIAVRPPAVLVVGLTKDKKFVINKEKRGTRGKVNFELPGGKVEKSNPSESEIKNKALEEFEEESGYKAGKIKLLKPYDINSNWLERRYYIFAVWDLKNVGQKLGPGEEIETVELGKKEVKQLLAEVNNIFPHERTAINQGIKFFEEKKLI